MIVILVLGLSPLAPPVSAQTSEGTRKVLTLEEGPRSRGYHRADRDQALGRSGQKTGEVYKLSFPRTDLIA
jgi:hypothetical protein